MKTLLFQIVFLSSFLAYGQISELTDLTENSENGLILFNSQQFLYFFSIF